VYLFTGSAGLSAAVRQTYAPSAPSAFGYALSRR